MIAATLSVFADESSRGIILTLVIVLAALGVAMAAITMWLVRSTRPDRALLGRLEVMGTRHWRRAGTAARKSELDAVLSAAQTRDPTPSGGFARPVIIKERLSDAIDAAIAEEAAALADEADEGADDVAAEADVVEPVAAEIEEPDGVEAASATEAPAEALSVDVPEGIEGVAPVVVSAQAEAEDAGEPVASDVIDAERESVPEPLSELVASGDVAAVADSEAKPVATGEDAARTAVTRVEEFSADGRAELDEDTDEWAGFEACVASDEHEPDGDTATVPTTTAPSAGDDDD